MALRAASNRARKLVPADRKAFLDGVAAIAGTQWRNSHTNNCSSHTTSVSENSRIPSHCNAGISKIPSLTSFLSAVLETHQRNRCAKLEMIRDVVGGSVFRIIKVGEEESQSEIGYQVVARRESQNSYKTSLRRQVSKRLLAQRAGPFLMRISSQSNSSYLP
jgi:hypothetical protein